MQAKAKTDYRRALAQFATGVTVVSTRTAAGAPVGLTVNSFNSVSLDPPLVLWSLSLKASSLDAFRRATHYAVSVLAAHQLDVAKRFAERGRTASARPPGTPARTICRSSMARSPR
jgi:flavin reductase (DIM6/NTAB) family NADH-FMN oxidoreductase RutF